MSERTTPEAVEKLWKLLRRGLTHDLASEILNTTLINLIADEECEDPVACAKKAQELVHRKVIDE